MGPTAYKTLDSHEVNVLRDVENRATGDDISGTEKHPRPDTAPAAPSPASSPCTDVPAANARRESAQNPKTGKTINLCTLQTGMIPELRNLLSREEQEQLLGSASLLEFDRGGTIIYCEGRDAGFVYFIDQGMVRISRCAENGCRQILAFRVPGDILGRPENGRYVNSAETVGPAKLYRVAWPRMQQLMRSEPRLQLHFLMKAADDFRQAERRIMILGQQNISQRLASFILDLLCVSELFDEKRSLLQLPVNRFDLADYLGTVTKSSERAFARLEQLSLIRRVTSRTIEILNADGLRLVLQEQRHSVPEASRTRYAAATFAKSNKTSPTDVGMNTDQAT